MLSGKRILVAGATGYLGGFVAEEFKSQGCLVRVLVRDPEKLGRFKGEVDEIVQGEVDEIVQGEVTDPASLAGICDQVDVVFSSIGKTRQKDHLTYMDVDYQGNLNLLREARKAGVAKFIYVSVFNAQKLEHLEIVRAKLRFEKELKASGLDYVIIRPNGFFSDMLEFLEMAKKGRGYVFGSGEYRLNPIHGRDLAQVCVKAVLGEKREIEVGGPDIMTHKEILSLAFDTCSKPLKMRRIPIWLRNILLTILRKFTSVNTYGPLEFFMTVLSMDMVAPAFGQHHLKEFFEAKE